ncbi:MAG: polysaccharide biosynthesis tyrosine autokinase [Candidatus Omnitrophica bacterium]|nr:polysaccharide biosynthesis tyrosine autokinase [Candidatus Omnitrophota bacterium]
MSEDFFSQAPEGEQPFEMPDWLEYLHILRASWRILSALTAAFVMAGTFFYANTPDEYTSKTRIVVEPMSLQENDPEYQRASMSRVMVDRPYVEMQAAFLVSPKAIAEARRDLSIPDATRVLNAESGWGEWFKSALLKVPFYYVAARQAGETRMIDLSVAGPDPEVTARLVNRLTAIFVRENAQEKFFMSQQVYGWLRDDAGEGAGPNLTPEVTGEEIESIGLIQNDDEIKRLKDDKQKILGEVRNLAQRYKPRHPVMASMRDELIKIDNAIADRKDRIVKTLRSSLEGKTAISNIRVLGVAHPPVSPSGPHRILGILMWGITGFLIGAFGILYSEKYNQKIRVEGDIPQSLKQAFLGNIPVVPNLARREELQKTDDPSVFFTDLMASELLLKDAVTTVRTHILFSASYQQSRRLMITSATEGEGKSTVSLLLGLSLASLGRKILLIDTDLRKPKLHEYLHLNNAKGLTDYLVGAAELREVVRPVPGTSLNVITAGQPTLNATGLISSDRFHGLIESLGETYDRVIVDTPPILRVPDALIIAKSVPCGILVCGSRIVDKKAVKKAKQKFDLMRRTLVGIILNRLDYEREYLGFEQGYYDEYKEKNRLRLKNDIPAQPAKSSVRPVRKN